MHELSIALSILDIASEESARRGGARIHAIHTRVGTWSGVVKEALATAFDLARESSPFPDCRLVIEEVPAVVYCGTCGGESTVTPDLWLCCSQCGRPTGHLLRGREMEVTAMEIEDSQGSDAAPILQNEV